MAPPLDVTSYPLLAAERRGSFAAAAASVGAGAEPVAAAVAALRAAVAEQALDQLDEAGLREVFAELTAAEGIVTAGQARTVSRLRRAGVVAADGARTTAGWIREQTGRSTREATRLANVAGLVDELPRTAEAVEQGRLTEESADAIGRAVRDGRLGPIDEVDRRLAAAGAASSPEELRRTIRRETQRRDGAAMLRDERRQHAARRLALVDQPDGMTAVNGLLPAEGGARLRAALQGLDRPDPADTPPERRRSHQQRLADALDSAATMLLSDGDLSMSGGRLPQVTVHVDLATVQADLAAIAGIDSLAAGSAGRAGGTTGPGEGATGLAGGADGPAAGAGGRAGGAVTDAAGAPEGPGPVPPDDPAWAGLPAGVLDAGQQLSPQAVRRILCDAAVVRVVTAGASLPLDVGRATREWSTAQRQGASARDRGCRGPWCDRPDRWTQLHHLRWWSRGGRTDIRNALSLCHACHRLVHDDGWVVRLDHDTGDVHWSGPAGQRALARMRPRPG